MAFNKFNVALLGSVTAAAMMAAGPVLADEVRDLKAQIEALSQKVQQIETQKAQPAVIPANVVTGGDFPGSFKMPGSNTSIKIGGYAKFDGIWDFSRKRGDGVGFPGAPAAGVRGTESNNGHVRFSALQTRFNIDSRTKSEGMGTVRGFVELDFYNSGQGNQLISNSTSPRMRHAFVTIGNVLAGQTWSTFMGLPSLADTIDFNGPAGQSFIRQGMIRYTMKMGGGSLALALENPNPTYTGGGTTGALGDTSDKAPDFVAKFKRGGDWGAASIQAVIQYISDGNATTTPGAAGAGKTDTAIGWGLGFTGRLYTWGKDNIRWQVNGGDGIGRYMVNNTQAGNAFFNTMTNKLETVPAYGGYIFYQHHFNPKWRTNFGVGGIKISNRAANSAAFLEDLVSGHVNLIWNATTKTNIGLEYRYSESTDENGETGIGSGLQLGVQHSF